MHINCATTSEYINKLKVSRLCLLITGVSGTELVGKFAPNFTENDSNCPRSISSHNNRFRLRSSLITVPTNFSIVLRAQKTNTFYSYRNITPHYCVISILTSHPRTSPKVIHPPLILMTFLSKTKKRRTKERRAKRRTTSSVPHYITRPIRKKGQSVAKLSDTTLLCRPRALPFVSGELSESSRAPRQARIPRREKFNCFRLTFFCFLCACGSAALSRSQVRSTTELPPSAPPAATADWWRGDDSQLFPDQLDCAQALWGQALFYRLVGFSALGFEKSLDWENERSNEIF